MTPPTGGNDDLVIAMRMIDQFTSTFKGFRKDLKQLEQNLDQLNGNAKKNFASIGGAGKQLTSALSGGFKLALKAVTSFQSILLGAGLVSGLQKIIGLATQFETGMAEISTLLSGKASKAVEGYRDKLEDMVKTSSRSLQDLTNALYQTISAGVTDEGQAFKVLDLAQKGAVAGLTDTSVAVDALTTIVNSFRLSADETTVASDLLFTTVQRGKTKFEPLAHNIGKVATLASQAGVSMEEMFAAIATMTKAGLDTEMATTALRQFFASILNPSDEAKKSLTALGIGFGKSALEGGKFTETLRQLHEKTNGNAEAMTKLVPNIRALMGGIVLAGEQFNVFKDDLDAMTNSAGATEEAFGKMAATSKEQLAIQMQRIELVLLKIGEKLLPGLLSALKNIATWFESNKDSIINAISSFSEAFGKVYNAVVLVGGAIKTAIADALTLYGLNPDTGAKSVANTIAQRQLERQTGEGWAKSEIDAVGGGSEKLGPQMRNVRTEGERRQLAEDIMAARNSIYQKITNQYQPAAEKAGNTNFSAAFAVDTLSNEYQKLGQMLETVSALYVKIQKNANQAGNSIVDDELKRKEAAEAAAAALKRQREEIDKLLERNRLARLTPTERLEEQYAAAKDIYKGHADKLKQIDEWYNDQKLAITQKALEKIDRLLERSELKRLSPMQKLNEQHQKLLAEYQGHKQALLMIDRWYETEKTNIETEAARKRREQKQKEEKEFLDWVQKDFLPKIEGEEQKAEPRKKEFVGQQILGQTGSVGSNIAQGASAGGFWGAIIGLVSSLAFSDMPTEEEIAKKRIDLEAEYKERKTDAEEQKAAALRRGETGRANEIADTIKAVDQWYETQQKEIDKEARGEFLNWFEKLDQKFRNIVRTLLHNIKGLLSVLPQYIIEGIVQISRDSNWVEMIVEGVYQGIIRAIDALSGLAMDFIKGRNGIRGAFARGSTLGLSDYVAKLFHSGGVVGFQKAHSGMYIAPPRYPPLRLQRDEVPIIAQTGEGVLSRTGMSRLAEAALNQMNAGGGFGGSSVNNYNLHLSGVVTTDDVQRWFSKVQRAATANRVGATSTRISGDGNPLERAGRSEKEVAA